jgi:DNA-binding NarL/FixJ family response regulator
MRAPQLRWHTGRMPLQCVIVDDNEPYLKLARATLERQGMVVVGVAANGTEALRQARALSPDVALVDISLGTESGFDVGRQITPYVGKIILISSHDEADYYAELIAAGPAVGFLSKAKLSADAIRHLVT